MRIFLADLGHNLLTKSSDTYPLGIANLAAWTQAHFRGEQPEIRLFREPQDLRAALDAEPPDVLGLSNYAWNEELAHHFAGYARGGHPGILTVMGGPNYPLVPEVQEAFLRGLPDVDVYVSGPTYEGERAFLELVQRYAEAGLSKQALLAQPVPGNHWIDPSTGVFVRGPEVERIRDLDQIPSPYRTGWMDPFLTSGYFPLLQIVRGCPFSCTFCNSGVKSNSRTYAHSVEEVKADLVWLAEHVSPETALCLADDNFGMYPRDEEIADHIGWLQDEYGWPKYIRTTTGKNKVDRIIRVMRKARGALPMTAAVQSMNPEVLANIKRDNIKLDTYRAIQEELDTQGMQSYGELILCLPGETRASFMKAVETLLDAGAKRISAHQLMLLHGAELSNPEAREKFGFGTRHRVVARNIGNYTGDPVVEVEEMVVETPDFSFQDYLDTRVFHLLLTIYYYEGNYEEAFEFARQHGVKPFDLIVRLTEMLDEAPAEFRQVIDDFLRESQEELFETREACLEWSRAHYDELVDGSLGGNLLSKYSMIGRFFATLPSLDFLERGVALAAAARDKPCDHEQLGAVVDYIRSVALHAPFEQSLARRVAWTTRWDVEAWSESGYEQPLADFQLPEERSATAETSPEVRALIEAKLEAFGEHPAGLGKFTRTMFARQLRRSFPSPSAHRHSA
jgi:radical SAM superfamily enzyme YgiQ (UPF0313 family)